LTLAPSVHPTMTTYAFLFSDKCFTLTPDQINSDPGNAFCKFFAGESGYCEMEIKSEPGLFRLIYHHLRGYDIFPILDGSVPYMSGETALKNLLKDAEEYELHGLVAKIREFQKAQAQPLPVQWKIIVRAIDFTQWKRN
jgi:hypothetical protein